MVVMLGQSSEFRLHLQISAGLSHCVATTTEGDLLTWGWNSAGQLGIGDDDSNSIAAVPQRALRLQSSSSTLLAAGRVHTIHSSGTEGLTARRDP